MNYDAQDAAPMPQRSCESLLFRSPSGGPTALPPGRGWRRSGKVADVRPPPTSTRPAADHREA